MKAISVFLLLLISVFAFAQNPGQGNAAWKVNGNTPTTGDFLGTIDDTPLFFKTNNLSRMVITKDGLIGIGNTKPTVTLDITGDLRLSGFAEFKGGLSLGGKLKIDTVEANTKDTNILFLSNALFQQDAFITNRLGIGTTFACRIARCFRRRHY